MKESLAAQIGDGGLKGQIALIDKHIIRHLEDKIKLEDQLWTQVGCQKDERTIIAEHIKKRKSINAKIADKMRIVRGYVKSSVWPKRNINKRVELQIGVGVRQQA